MPLTIECTDRHSTVVTASVTTLALKICAFMSWAWTYTAGYGVVGADKQIPFSIQRRPADTPQLYFNDLIYGRRKSVLLSHAFENLREDMWAGFVDTDTRLR